MLLSNLSWDYQILAQPMQVLHFWKGAQLAEFETIIRVSFAIVYHHSVSFSIICPHLLFPLSEAPSETNDFQMMLTFSFENYWQRMRFLKEQNRIRYKSD